MAKWTIQINTGAGFTAYKMLDLGFHLGLNTMSTFTAVVAPGTTAPDKGDEVKVWWDLGGAQERLWLRGLITTKRTDPMRGVVHIQGHDDSFSLYQSRLGGKADNGFRNYGSDTPYSILTSAGSPLGLIYNAQGNAIMTYGTSAPNAITGASPGNALTFRAHSGGTLLNLARLCEQATSGAGPTYGLEWFVDRDGADAKRLNVVTRRQRAAVYTAEQFQIGKDLFRAPQSTEADEEYDRVLVIGEGSGTTRIESSWVGAGTREYIYTDKSITNATTATNLANRILNALNQGSTPRFEARTHRHNMITHVGDDVDIVPRGGGAATTYRCLGMKYDYRSRAFTLEIGRVRRFLATVLRDLEKGMDGSENHTQLTDTKRPGAAAVLNTQPASTGVSTIAANGSIVTTLNFTDRTFTPATDEGIQFHIQVGCYNTGTTNGRRTPIDVVLEFGGGTRIMEVGGTTASGGVNILGRWETSFYYSAQFMEDVIGAGGTLNSAVLTAINRDSVDVDMIVQLSAHVIPPHEHNAS